jgi:hypothetical protein
MLRLGLLAGPALALTLLMTSSASAQLGGRGFSIPPTVQNIMLLRVDAVQKELSLNEEQAKSIADVGAQMQSDAMEIFSGLQDLTPEERQKELPELMKLMTEKAKELQAKVDKILMPPQSARLKELSIQRRGVEALQDDEVAKALKISDEQKKKLVGLRDEAGEKQQEIIQAVLSGGGDRSGIREKIQALQKEFGEKALAILSSEQREQFEKLKGAKFDFPPQRGFGF